MGALEHNDLRSTRDDQYSVADLLPALNRQLARIARVVTTNFRNPLSVQAQSNRDGPVLIATESVELDSIVLMNPAAPNVVLSGITTGGVAIPNDATLPLSMTPGTYYTVNATPAKRINANEDISLAYTTTNASGTGVALNVRRLG